MRALSPGIGLLDLLQMVLIRGISLGQTTHSCLFYNFIRICMYRRRYPDDPQDTWATNKHNFTMGVKSSPRYKIPDQLLSRSPEYEAMEQRDYQNVTPHKDLSYSKMLDTQTNKEGPRESKRFIRHDNPIVPTPKRQPQRRVDPDLTMSDQNKRLKSENQEVKSELQELSQKYKLLKIDYDSIKFPSQKTFRHAQSKKQLLKDLTDLHEHRRIHHENEGFSQTIAGRQRKNNDLEKENHLLRQDCRVLTSRLHQLQCLQSRFQQLLKNYKSLEKTVEEDEHEWAYQKTLWKREVQHYRYTIKQLQRQLQLKRRRQY